VSSSALRRGCVIVAVMSWPLSLDRHGVIIAVLSSSHHHCVVVVGSLQCCLHHRIMAMSSLLSRHRHLRHCIVAVSSSSHRHYVVVVVVTVGVVTVIVIAIMLSLLSLSLSLLSLPSHRCCCCCRYCVIAVVAINAYSFRQYMNNIVRAYRNQVVDLIGICRLFSQVALSMSSATTKYFSLQAWAALKSALSHT